MKVTPEKNPRAKDRDVGDSVLAPDRTEYSIMNNMSRFNLSTLDKGD